MPEWEALFSTSNELRDSLKAMVDEVIRQSPKNTIVYAYGVFVEPTTVSEEKKCQSRLADYKKK